MTNPEAEKIVRAELGDNYTPVKVSRYWLIVKYADDGSHALVAQRTSLPRAIADAKGGA